MHCAREPLEPRMCSNQNAPSILEHASLVLSNPANVIREMHHAVPPLALIGLGAAEHHERVELYQEIQIWSTHF